MGKNSKSAKKRRRVETFDQQAERLAKKIVATRPVDLGDSDDDKCDLENDASLDASLSNTNVRTTLRTLEALVKRPEMYRSADFKPLRTLIHSLHNPTKVSYTYRISELLTGGNWGDALLALQEMRRSGEVPKLGAVQRWVRDCDAKGGDPLALRVLDGILRTAAPEQVASVSRDPSTRLEVGTSNTDGNAILRGATVYQYPEWTSSSSRPHVLEDDATPVHTTDYYREQVSVLKHINAADRRPPNKHDMDIYHSQSNTIPFTPLSELEQLPKRVPVPFVPGAFLLQNVFTEAECQCFIEAAEAMGYQQDEPDGDDRGKLAQTFVWLVDDSILQPLYERCLKLLDQEVQGGKVCGVNARWRMYRYQPGLLYRPHVDGAWPGSGLDSEGEYVYDAYGDRWSRFTFLIYLNQDFEGGCTTFYTPSAEEGFLDAQGVRPRAGSILVFPHGDTAGTLVHEGSAVTKGMKYIARTDLLYMLPEDVIAKRKKQNQRMKAINDV